MTFIFYDLIDLFLKTEDSQIPNSVKHVIVVWSPFFNLIRFVRIRIIDRGRHQTMLRILLLSRNCILIKCIPWLMVLDNVKSSMSIKYLRVSYFQFPLLSAPITVRLLGLQKSNSLISISTWEMESSMTFPSIAKDRCSCVPADKALSIFRFALLNEKEIY